MKRKTILALITVCILSFASCGKQETTATTESVPATVESTQAETTVTEETVTAEDAAETYQTNMEEVRNKMFGLDGITASEDKTTSSEASSSGMNSSQPYYPSSTPCGNSQKQQAWNDFCENWNESDYGTTTKGKTQNDFPYYGRTGYDSSLLEYRTTDKGYTVMYDTATGRVYYTGMTLPTGDAWDDTTSGGVISQYIIDNNLTGMYDLTYAQFQELLGTYAGD